MGLTLSIIRDAAELTPHEPAWRELLERSLQNEPALTPFWLRAWWRVFGADGGRRLRVALAFDGERLVGLAPLQARRHWYRPGLPFRRLELLGSGEAEADEICSEYLGVIAERGSEGVVMRELTAALRRGALGGWDEAVFPVMHGELSTTKLLVSELERAGFATTTKLASECPFIPLPASFDAYLAELSSSSRSFVKHSLSSFDAWAKGEEELFEVRSERDLARGNAVLRALHSERWGGAHGDGVFASSRFSAFHADVMPALLDAGALELSCLSVRGEPVAALYNFVWNDKVYFYQSGRKLDVPNRVRPGIVLHLRAIRRAIERGRREYDFLGGASQYKRALATRTRPLVTVRVVRARGRDLLRSRVERGTHAVRKVLERVL